MIRTTPQHRASIEEALHRIERWIDEHPTAGFVPEYEGHAARLRTLLDETEATDGLSIDEMTFAAQAVADRLEALQ